jgi:hypothetical protein
LLQCLPRRLRHIGTKCHGVNWPLSFLLRHTGDSIPQRCDASPKHGAPVSRPMNYHAPAAKNAARKEVRRG